MIVTPAPLYIPGDAPVTIRLRPFYKIVLSAGTVANQQNADFTLTDPNYVLLIRSLSLQGTPNAADTINETNILMRSPATDATQTQLTIMEQLVATAAGVRQQLSWQGDIPLMPGWIIRGRGIKAASANIFQTSLSIVGWLVPIGNLQLTAS